MIWVFVSGYYGYYDISSKAEAFIYLGSQALISIFQIKFFFFIVFGFPKMKWSIKALLVSTNPYVSVSEQELFLFLLKSLLW